MEENTTQTAQPAGDVKSALAATMIAALNNAGVTPAGSTVPAQAPAQPISTPPAQAQAPATPPVDPAKPAEAAPAPAPDATAAPPAEPAPPEFDIDNFSFDAPAEPDPNAPPVAPAEPEAPLVSEAERAELEAALTKEEADTLTKALGSPKAAQILETLALRSERGKRQLQAFKVLREIAKPPAEGGLGFTPSTEQIRSFYENSSAWEQATHEFEANPSSWVANMFGPNAQTGKNPAGAEKALLAIHQLPAHSEESRALYARAVEAPIVRNIVDALYNWANSTPPELNKDANGIGDRDKILNAARVAEKMYFGSFRSDAQPEQIDPNSPIAQAAAQLRQREQALNAREQQAARQALAQFDGAFFSSASAQMDKDIDALFAASGAAKLYPNPRVQADLKNGFKNKVIYLTEGNAQTGQAPFNPYQMSQLNIIRNQAKRAFLTGSQADQSAALNLYRQMAQEVIKVEGRQFLKDIMAGGIAASAAKHEQLAAAASRTAPAVSSGVPAPQSVLPAPSMTPQPGESKDAMRARIIREGMMNALGKRV